MRDLAVDGLSEKIGAVGPMTVDRRTGNSRTLCNGFDSGSPKPDFTEQLGGGFEYNVASSFDTWVNRHPQSIYRTAVLRFATLMF